MSSNVAIALKQITKRYALYARPLDRMLDLLCGIQRNRQMVNALSGVSLTVERGQIVGIVGRNGSGKSTLLQIICGTLSETSGTKQIDGRISALLELGAGFNPEFTGRENIFLNAAILGLTQQEIHMRYDTIVSFSGLKPEQIAQPVRTYSSGMVVRLAFAIAVATEPEILIVDEALAVGDEAFQRKCYAKIQAMREAGATILFVSHSARTILELCDHAVLMEQGRILLQGEPKQIISAYQQLIHAPENRQAAIAKRIAQGKLEEEEASVIAPESTTHYTPQGAELLNPVLLDHKERKIALVARGQKLVFRVEVVFTELFTALRKQGISELQCGMMIKSLSGVQLGTGRYVFSSLPKAGDHVTLSFAFTARLQSGSYFINCGCTAVTDVGIKKLHRIEDAVMFKIKIEDGQRGMVDFGIEPSLVQKKADKKRHKKKKKK